MHLRALNIALGALALVQASCGEPTGDTSPGETTIPVRFSRSPAGTQLCEPTFPSLTTRLRHDSPVTWTLQSSCDLAAGHQARVSLANWTFTDESGRKTPGKHPFMADCPMVTTMAGGEAATISCPIAPDARRGAYQYFVCIESEGRTHCWDPIIIDDL